jgi:hypothetical protein
MAFWELEKPLTTPEQERRDIRFVAKKLQIPTSELEDLLALPAISHQRYPGSTGLYTAIAGIRGAFRRIARSRSA